MKDPSSKSHIPRKRVPQGPINRYEYTMGHNSSGLPNELDPPPVYEAMVEEVNIAQEDFNASARILDDGRVNINIDLNQEQLSTLIAPEYREYLQEIAVEKEHATPEASIPQSVTGALDRPKPPSLNLVIQVVGSQGDVEPFIALGKILKVTYNHRVRLATHLIFKKFVEENGLEFFNIGGDPASFMALMVNNSGLILNMEVTKDSPISRRRKEIFEIMQGCWRSCFESGDGTGAEHENLPLTGPRKEFVADAIIANPPSFAHIHCAEKLGIPLHLMFTMPWSATQAFPHPLANIQTSNVDASLKNFMSYPMVEMMMWQGLGGTTNTFRSKVLELEPVRVLWGPKGVSKLKIPHTYLWSPSLIPKPADWGSHISVTGYSLLRPVSNYTPDPALKEFLDDSPTPIYIGFGSISINDSESLLQILILAVRLSGQRAIISRGRGGLSTSTPMKGIFFVDNVPHDWLFARVSCVVHHGGAGTTAAGIRYGKPTVIIPFFGDQFFWGSMIARAGAGPRPIPARELSADKLAEAIESSLSPTIRRLAQELGERISDEQGAEMSCLNFHQKLDLDTLRCGLDPSRSTVWTVRRSKVRLSAFCATVLIDAGLLRFKDLSLYRPREYVLEDGPWDPITGTISACLNMVGSMVMGVADVPLEISRARKGKSIQNSSQQNFEGSEDSNNIEASRRRRSGIQVSTPDTYQSAIPSSAADRAPCFSETRSRGSSFSNGVESGELYANSSYSGEGEGRRQSVMSLKSSGSGTAVSKKDYGILKTSNGALLGTSKAVGKIIVAGVKSPFEVSLNAARGFHNVPRLYGDETVRPHERITGVWSGLKAAGKGFTFGVYDGVSGLWMQPIEGNRKEGTIGALKGVGKGIGGLALKPVAGTWGVIGYTFDGVNKEMQKMFGANVETHIIASRKAQGFEEFRRATPEEKALVLERWRSVISKI